jgi:hypothetical protein
MKKRIEYICEVCDLTSHNKEKVENCEKSHVKPTSIIRVEYAPGECYPLFITIRFSNGRIKELTYR